MNLLLLCMREFMRIPDQRKLSLPRKRESFQDALVIMLGVIVTPAKAGVHASLEIADFRPPIET